MNVIYLDFAKAASEAASEVRGVWSFGKVAVIDKGVVVE